MHLITMAHLGEAQGVIEKFALKRHSPSFFEGEDICLIITGEGPFEAAITTSLHLGRKTFYKVINLGIAGTLDPSLKVGQIFQTRSHYLFLENKPVFKSFQAGGGLDCITTFERILSPEKVAPLKGLATLVDRESWGVAFAAKNAGIPFESYKLISDLAGTMEACEVVKENAQVWSFQLADHLEKVLDIKPTKDDALELSGFYFTFTMEHRFQDLLKKLSIKEEKSQNEILAILPLNNLREQKILPKERAFKLIESMEERLNPLNKIIDNQINSWKSPYQNQGIQIQHDQQLENDLVKIQFEIKNNQELKEKLVILEKFSMAPFKAMLQGKFNVE